MTTKLTKKEKTIIFLGFAVITITVSFVAVSLMPVQSELEITPECKRALELTILAKENYPAFYESFLTIASMKCK